MEWSRVVRRGLLGGLMVTLAILLRADVPVAATGSAVTLSRHDPVKIHHLRDGVAYSTNWSGYAVTGNPGSVTDVKASWVVPAVTCSAGQTQYSSFWVGIDGYSDNTVEQTGTDSDCQNGVPTYYAWFEFYPHPMMQVNTLTVHANDVISAEAKYVGNNRYQVTVTDITTHQSFSDTSRLSSAQRASAEWIAEAPSSIGGVLPLANFGVADFGQNYTPVSNTGSATVGGKNGLIGSFGSNVQTINMVESDGVTPKATPSSLSGDGSSFAVTWHNQ